MTNPKTEPPYRPDICWCGVRHLLGAGHDSITKPKAAEQSAPLDVERVERLAETIHERECGGDPHPLSSHKSLHIAAGYRGKARVMLDTLAAARLAPQPSERSEPARCGEEGVHHHQVASGMSIQFQPGHPMEAVPARYRPQPARSADTALREALERLNTSFTIFLRMSEQAHNRHIAPGWHQFIEDRAEEVRAALAAQPTSATPQPYDPREGQYP